MGCFTADGGSKYALTLSKDELLSLFAGSSLSSYEAVMDFLHLYMLDMLSELQYFCYGHTSSFWNDVQAVAYEGLDLVEWIVKAYAATERFQFRCSETIYLGGFAHMSLIWPTLSILASLAMT